MFGKIYLETINPTAKYSVLFSYEVLFSIIFHAVAYLLIIYILSYLFKFSITNKQFIKISIVLIIVMVLGYIGRLWRSKNLYKSLLKKNMNSQLAKQKTIDIIHHGYFKFYFLG